MDYLGLVCNLEHLEHWYKYKSAGIADIQILGEALPL